jgi:hypothetical protein
MQSNPVDPSVGGGPFPIVVGIVGHRDLRHEDVPELERIVEQILLTTRRQSPASRLVVLSSLAEGADRLGARVALRCGARLVVPLPMEPEMFIADFDGDASREEFEGLLAAADATMVQPYPEGVAESDVVEPGAARNEQYRRAGVFIARHCHFLIALWDGEPSPHIGGTAHLITYCLSHGYDRPESELLNTPENTPVYHVRTPRRSNPDIAGPCEVHRPVPAGADRYEADRTLRYVIERTDRFNADAARLDRSLARARERSREWLLPDEDVTPELREGIEEMRPELDLFAGVDAIAQGLGRRTHRVMAALFVIVTIAALTFDVYTHLFPETWMLLGAYLAALTGTYALVAHSRRRGYQGRYLDYRALAEGLRVAIFWRIAGVPDSVADSYFEEQRSELDWVRYALRLWDIDRPPKPAGASAGAPAVAPEQASSGAIRLHLAARRWVAEQRDYFERASKRDERRLHRSERWERGLVLTGIAIASVQLALAAFVTGGHADHLMLIATAMAPIFAGLLIGYVEKRAYASQAKQYLRMHVLFANASMHVDRMIADGRLDAARRLLALLGKEALAENGEWVLLHRERPIEMPKA